MNRLGIERLCVFGMPPVEFAHLVADLGCGSIGIGLAPTPGFNPDNHRQWSLREDRALRREFADVLRERKLRVGIVEGFAIRLGHDPASFAEDLAITREIGADRINVVSLDKDIDRTIEGFAKLTELAAEHGLLVSAEMGSLGPIGQVDQALAVARGVGLANFSLLVDAMHFFRLGNTMEQFAAIDPALIGYVQLCDAPWAPRFETYIEEAMYERMAPGDGELPLAEFVAALPAGVTVSLEIPQRSLAEAGIGPCDRLAPCVAAARALLAAHASG